MQNFLHGWGLVILSGILDSSAIILIKKSLNRFGKIPLESVGLTFDYLIDFLKSPISLAGILFYLCSPFIWFLALSRLEVSKAYPVLVSIHLVLSFLLAVMFLDEKLTLIKMIALFMILTGAILLINKQA
ncbi:MAG: hypothetical protein A3G23_04060 [Bacteroidetes bacterium RIFCSPLOWO2_12_FULL_37_12]|nr:MAG: hypothetical protein A3G23_04060 [Bacteroidetes bacterium RIFCSPLOWO2_12_FULL_37_12]